jgi:hypothetical protein
LRDFLQRGRRSERLGYSGLGLAVSAKIGNVSFLNLSVDDRGPERYEQVRRHLLFQAAVNVRGDRMGVVPGAIESAPDVACTQWFKLHFLSDGRSPFCCMDSEAKWGVGDVTRDHAIHSIYSHPARR